MEFLEEKVFWSKNKSLDQIELGDGTEAEKKLFVNDDQQVVTDQKRCGSTIQACGGSRADTEQLVYLYYRQGRGREDVLGWEMLVQQQKVLVGRKMEVFVLMHNSFSGLVLFVHHVLHQPLNHQKMMMLKRNLMEEEIV